ncbi:MAG: glycosyltransferase [Candidatus Omnitrophica bacterium]|nr:glycosyltransferase [Candidatus Omnitrophota bacterium]
MTEKMKKVSVIIPAYNKADLTVRTVESVLAQTYVNIEIIVVDDGSTDDTKDRLSPYLGRIRYEYKDNGGACSARNLGISLAEGEYVGLLDCDDLYLPDKIERSVMSLEEDPGAGFVHTSSLFIDDDDNTVGRFSVKGRKEGWITKDLILRNFICNSTVVARRICFDEVGLFDETIFIPADWDMWLRLSERYRAKYIDEPLTKHRNPESYTRKNLDESLSSGITVLKKAFERNPHLKDLRPKAYSALHYRQARYYGRIGDDSGMEEQILLALKQDRYNFKAVCMYLALKCVKGIIKP